MPFLIPHPFRHHLSVPLRRLLIHDVMRDGRVSESQATAAVDKFEGEHPILDMLASVDWAAVLKLVLAFLPLIVGATPPTANYYGPSEPEV